MKVLIICPFFPPSLESGGPAAVALGHAIGLQDAGVSVTVATSDLLGLTPIRRWSALAAPPVDLVRVLRFRGHLALPTTLTKRLQLNPMPFVFSRALHSWAHRNVSQFDVVHVHFAREPIATSVTMAARRMRVPYFLQPHGMLGRTQGVRSLIDQLLVADLVRSAAGLIALNETEQKSLRLMAPAQEINIVGNPVTAFVASAPSPGGKPTVLFLARLHTRKRVEAFIEMAQQLQDRGHDYRFVVAGPDDGRLESARALARALGLSAIEFLGALEPSRAREEISHADVYVLPSVNEPYPMTLLEAMYAGTPAVVTTGCHIHTQLTASGAAVVTDPDPEALADGVERALDPRYRDALVLNAKVWIASNASTRSVGDRLVNLYRTAMTD